MRRACPIEEDGETAAARSGSDGSTQRIMQRLIRLTPVQERYGPSLPQLLAPRLDRLPAIARGVGAVVGVVIMVVVVALVLRTRNPVYTGATGPVRFSVEYPRSMTKEPTPHGALLLLVQRDSEGLVASFEVQPLHLPAYFGDISGPSYELQPPGHRPHFLGEISGLLPVIAINYEQKLAARTRAFELQSLGRTRIITTAAFTFTYSFYPPGSQAQYFGRVVFITPNLSGNRTGLLLSMVQLPATLKAATAPAEPTPDAVGAGGPLQDPLQHLRIS
jgi:hypothetical protein